MGLSSNPSPPGHAVPLFATAVDALQLEGFRTALDVERHSGVCTLRWRKRGARWRATVSGRTLSGALDQVGRLALGWLQARERGDGHEGLYAEEDRRDYG